MICALAAVRTHLRAFDLLKCLFRTVSHAVRSRFSIQSNGLWRTRRLLGCRNPDWSSLPYRRQIVGENAHQRRSVHHCQQSVWQGSGFRGQQTLGSCTKALSARLWVCFCRRRRSRENRRMACRTQQLCVWGFSRRCLRNWSKVSAKCCGLRVVASATQPVSLTLYQAI
jgi:hypothetical protein